MLEASVFEYSSEAPGHPANAICYHAKNGLGWIPDSQQQYPQHVTLRLNDGVSKIASIKIHLTDTELRFNIEVQFGELIVDEITGDLSDYNFKTVWNGKTDKIKDNSSTGFTINVKGQVEYIRIQINSDDNNKENGNINNALGIISVEMFSEKIGRIKRAKLSAITRRLVKANSNLKMNIKQLPDLQIPLTVPIEKTGAGQGTACYFTLMKYMAIVFSIGTIFSIIMVILFSLFQSNTENDFTSWLIDISLYNVIAGYWNGYNNATLFNFLLLPEIIFAVVIYVGILLLRRQVENSAEEADDANISCGDYGMMVEGLPKDEKSAEKVFNHFNLLAPVNSVLLCYDCNKHVQTQEIIDKKVKDYHSTIREDDTSLENICHFSLYNLTATQRVLDFNQNEKGKQYRGKIAKLLNKRNLISNPEDEEETTGIAFVIFKKALDMQEVARKYYRHTNISFLGQYPLRITPGIEPDDVYFENLGYTYKERFIRKHLFRDLIALVLVAIGVVGPYFLNRYKTQQNNFFVSILLSLAITVISSVIFLLINLMKPFTKPITQTELISSSLFSIWFEDFTLSALASYIFSAFDQKKVLFDESRPESQTRFFMSYQWFSDIAVNLLTNVLINYAKNTINKAFDPPYWVLDNKLAMSIKIIFISLMISPFMPIVIPITAIYFIAMFWIDKHNILRFYKAPIQYSREIISSTIVYLENAFHLHCIITIISYFFIILNIPEQNRVKQYYINGIVFSVIYSIIFIISVMSFIYDIKPKSLFNKLHIPKKKPRDETFGQQFAEYESIIMNFIDKHPCYNESEVHELFNTLRTQHYQENDDQDDDQIYDTSPIQEYKYYSYFPDNNVHSRGIKKKMTSFQYNAINIQYGSIRDVFFEDETQQVKRPSSPSSLQYSSSSLSIISYMPVVGNVWNCCSKDQIQPQVQAETKNFEEEAVHVIDESTNFHSKDFPDWESPNNLKVNQSRNPLFITKQPFHCTSLTKEKKIQLLRPQEMFNLDQSKFAIFANGDWNCVQQGMIGDSQFISAMISMRYMEERIGKPLIKNKLFPQDENRNALYNPNGRYQLHLHVNGAWRFSEIDDLLPCLPLIVGQNQNFKPRTIAVAHSVNQGELWVSLIEKAYLNVVGDGYDSRLISGPDAIFALSGWIVDQQFSLQSIFQNDKEFEKLERRFERNEIIVLISIPARAFSKSDEENFGLDLFNTYALLRVVKVGEKKLLLIRNPKREKIWKGNLSKWDLDGWTSELQQATGFKPVASEQEAQKDGLFWMDVDNAKKYFTSGQLCWNPSLFPHQTEFHFTWQYKAYMIKDKDMNIRYAPQFLFKRQSKTQMIKIVINRHYQSSVPISKDATTYKQSKDDNNQKEEVISYTMFLIKHKKQIKVRTDSGIEIISAIGETNYEPTIPRIYSNDSQIIPTNFNSSHLRVLNIGIRDKDDIHDAPKENKLNDQKMQEEFTDYVGYFTAILQMENIPKSTTGELRFSIYVYSNEPLQCAKRIPVHFAQEKTILSSWPKKPMMNCQVDKTESVKIGSEQYAQYIDTDLIIRKSCEINPNSPTVTKQKLHEYFLDSQGNKDEALLEIFQHATQSLFAPHHIFRLTPNSWSNQFGTELVVYGAWSKRPIGDEKCPVEAYINYKVLDNEIPHIVNSGNIEKIPENKIFFERLYQLPEKRQKVKQWSTSVRIPLSQQKKDNIDEQNTSSDSNDGILNSVFQVEKAYTILVSPFTDIRNWESRDEYKLTYIPPVGYRCQEEELISPWQMMKYELSWTDSIHNDQELPDKENKFRHKYEIMRVPQSTDIFILFIASQETDTKQPFNPQFKLHFIGHDCKDYGSDERKTINESAAAKIQSMTNNQQDVTDELAWSIDSKNSKVQPTSYKIKRIKKNENERNTIRAIKLKKIQEEKEKKQKEAEQKKKLNQYLEESDDDQNDKIFMFVDNTHIDEETDQDFFDWKQISLVWRYGACTLPCGGDYLFDIKLPKNSEMNFWAFVWTDKQPVELLSLDTNYAPPKVPKTSIFPIIDPYQRWIRDSFTRMPMIQNLRKAEKLLTENSKSLLHSKSEPTSKSGEILSKKDLIQLFGNEDKAFMYYINSHQVFGPQYDIIFNPKRYQQEYGSQVLIKMKFEGGLKGNILANPIAKEQICYSIKINPGKRWAQIIKLIERNIENSLYSNIPNTNQQNIKVEFKKSQENNIIDVCKHIIRISPQIEFDHINCRDSFTISFNPPNGYETQIEKIPAPQLEMKYEAVWEDSFSRSFDSPIHISSKVKYRFAIIRTEQPTNIFLQILTFARTSRKFDRQPQFRVIKISENLQNPQDIKIMLDKLKMDQMNIMGKDIIFKNDEKCQTEQIVSTSKNDKVIACFPCSQSRLPKDGDYLVEFSVKGQDLFKMVGFIWTNSCPIEVFYLQE